MNRTMQLVAALCMSLALPGLVAHEAAAAPATKGTSCPPAGSVYGVAHQGAHDRAGGYRTYRNTVPAFKKAQDRCQWVESDVRFTKDLKPVMMHDKRTGPMFRYQCDLVVAQSTLAEIRQACRKPDGSTVATFGQFLKAVSLGGFVEIKKDSTSDAKLKILIRKIYKHGDEDVVALKFTDEWLLKRIAKLDKNAKPISRVWKGALVAYPDRVAAVCDFAVYSYAKFSSKVVGRLNDRGVGSVTSVSTTSGTSQWTQLAAVGAFGAETDYSKQMYDWQNSQ